MNTYLFIRIERHCYCPELNYTIQADTVEEAIGAAGFYPYCLDDFAEARTHNPPVTFEEWEQNVFDYYGLGSDEAFRNSGNSDDGNYHIITCTPDGSDPTKVPVVYPSWS